MTLVSTRIFKVTPLSRPSSFLFICSSVRFGSKVFDGLQAAPVLVLRDLTRLASFIDADQRSAGGKETKDRISGEGTSSLVRTRVRDGISMFPEFRKREVSCWKEW